MNKFMYLCIDKKNFMNNDRNKWLDEICNLTYRDIFNFLKDYLEENTCIEEDNCIANSFEYIMNIYKESTGKFPY
nr:MAG TPA: hypothetical protein [Ackermannviridae sp.]